MFDVVVAGHFAIDSIFLPNARLPCVVLGGSTTYASLAARRLGARVSIVSKVGGDFPSAYLWWLGQEGIDTSNVVKVESAQTTRFELKYSDNLTSRTLRLKSRAPAMNTEDLPKSLEAKATHVAPIASEITYDVLEQLRSNAGILSLDPQGLVRSFDGEGNVTYGPMTESRVLECVNVYKSSLDEIKAITGLPDVNSAIKAVHNSGVETVIVTLGAKGAVLSVEATTHDIPSYPPEKVVDPTGAGDAFIGAFLAEYVKGEDSLWCACSGSAAASLVVEALGPTFRDDKEEIFRRARVLYEKEIKQ